MKTVKTLLAISVLAAAGAANAATYNYSVDLTGLITGIATGAMSSSDGTPGADPIGMVAPGAGTAVYDDVANTLFVDVKYVTYSPPAGGDFTVRTTYSYNLTGLNTTSGTGVNVSCTAGSTACPGPLNLGTPFALTATGAGNGGGLLQQAFNVAGGQNTFVVKQYNGLLQNSYSLNFTPTVPVPAAAWLFGSGLLGLAGTARRRRAA